MTLFYGDVTGTLRLHSRGRLVLFEPDCCQRRRQMRLANACCRYSELVENDGSLGQRDGEQQRCACPASKGDRWPGYDYNERARLCDCCGRYVLRSGSRWSVWFCEECKARVKALNEEMGFALIPVGRHSMMNGLGLRGEAKGYEIAQFSDQLRDLCSRMDLLSKTWKLAHLRRELKRLGFLGAGATGPGAVPLSVYLEAVADEDRVSSVDLRLRAFGGLGKVFGV